MPPLEPTVPPVANFEDPPSTSVTQTFESNKAVPPPGAHTSGFIQSRNGPGWFSGTRGPMYQDPSQEAWNNARDLVSSFSSSDYDHFVQDIYNRNYKVDRMTSLASYAPMSLANRYALFTWWGLHGDPRMNNINKYYYDLCMKDGGESIVRPKESDKISTSALIDYFSTGRFGAIEYAWSDFLWTKFHKYIPNNYLLTLRRFPHPCEDNIYSVIQTARKRKTKIDKKTKKPVIDSEAKVDNMAANVDAQDVITRDLTIPDIARAVTWMSESTGNKMEDILSFTYGYNWKEQTAQTNTYESQKTGYTAQPFYQKMGTVGKGIMNTIRGLSQAEVDLRSKMSGHDPIAETYQNFVLGPINVINKMYTRDVGLNFNQEIKLTFEYQLKTYAGLNPKIALLDIMSNLLVLTYSNANFWGGANRFYGGGGYVAKEFGDLQELAKGNYKGYLSSVVTEIGGGLSAIFGSPGTGAYTNFTSLLDGIKTLFSGVTGALMGSFINKQIGSLPAYQATAAFLSGEPTGDWHLTIGNPINPIMMIGNLILSDSKLSFSGGLGFDDFPLELKLECTLKHARPRDKSDFESAFNAGKGRLYAGSDTIGDLLNIKGNDVQTYGSLSGILADQGKMRKFKSVGNDSLRNHKVTAEDAIDFANVASSEDTRKAFAKRFEGWQKGITDQTKEGIAIGMAIINR